MDDRVRGTLLGLAAGDALGAGYEFNSNPPKQPVMKGGGLGPWEPGEWTDDTQMALCVALAIVDDDGSTRAIGERFLEWYREGQLRRR